MDGPYFKIGEFAQLMGVSPDALRYFEDRGILVPHRDPANGYRYYSIDCSPLMTRFRLLRACGLSYEQTLEPSSSIASSEFAPLLDIRIGEIDRFIARLQCERTVLNEYKELSKRILSAPDFLSIETVDKTFYFYSQFYNEQAINDKERQPVIRALTSALPLAFFVVLPDGQSAFLDRAEEQDLYGVMIDEQYIPLLDDPGLFAYPDRKIHFDTVCRFVSVIEHDKPWPSRLRQVRDQLLEQGYELIGDPVIRILPESVQVARSYMEVLFPIRKNPHKQEKGESK